MSRWKAIVWVLLFSAVSGVLYAQSSEDPDLSSDDSNRGSTADRPIGGVKMKLKAPAGASPTGSPAVTPPGNPPVPPPEADDIPPDEPPPEPPPPEDPPPFYDEPLDGKKFVLVLDRSGSMGGSRIATVRAEAIDAINQLTEDYEFDIEAFNSSVTFMWGDLMPATEANRSAAVGWINSPYLNAGGGTASYAALQQACDRYPADLDKMFFLSDGDPTVGPSKSYILAEFPDWWAKFEECDLVCICIGGSSSAAAFMQLLATNVGGTYIAR